RGGAFRTAFALSAPAFRRRAAARGAGARLRDGAGSAVRGRTHGQPGYAHRRGCGEPAVPHERGIRHHPGTGDARSATGQSLRPRAAHRSRAFGERMKGWRLAWRFFKRDLAAGEVRVLLAALALAVMAVASVAFVTERA